MAYLALVGQTSSLVKEANHFLEMVAIYFLGVVGILLQGVAAISFPKLLAIYFQEEVAYEAFVVLVPSLHFSCE